MQSIILIIIQLVAKTDDLLFAILLTIQIAILLAILLISQIVYEIPYSSTSYKQIIIPVYIIFNYKITCIELLRNVTPNASPSGIIQLSNHNRQPANHA